MTRSSAGDEKTLDESALQLREMSLNVDGSSSFDKVLTENRGSSHLKVGDDLAEADTTMAVESRTRCWTLDGFISEYSNDIISGDLPSLNVDDQLTSADDDCDILSVDNVSSQQPSVGSGLSLASVQHVTQCNPACECYKDNRRSSPTSCEWSELFSCRECSIEFSKHFVCDSLHTVLRVIRPSQVDCTMFRDASLNVVKSEIYLTKVNVQTVSNTFLYCLSVL